MASSEYDEIVKFSKLFEDLVCMWSYVNSGFGGLSIWEYDVQQYIVRNVRWLIAMDQGLVQIEDESVLCSRYWTRHLGAGMSANIRPLNSTSYI